jgi:phenylacetate-CoA ligase
MNKNQTNLPEKISLVLDLAFSQIPYYKNLYSSEGFSRQNVLSLEDFKKLPLLFKKDLRLGFPDGFIPEGQSIAKLMNADRLLRIHTSSGTTDERIEVLYSDRLAAWPKNLNTIWAPKKNLGLFSRTAVLTSPVCAGYICHLDQKNYLERLKGQTLTCATPTSLFNAKEKDFIRFYEEWERFKPDLFLANPLYACWFLDGCKKLNLKLTPPSVVLSSYQYLSKVQRDYITKNLNAPVYNYYAATDLGGPAVAFDTHDSSMKINTDNVYVEVIYPPNVTDKRFGYIAVTTLNNPIFPLIRYVIGDLGSLIYENNDLQSATRLVLAGRSKEVINLKDQRIVTVSDLDDCFRNEKNIMNYQLSQLTHSKYELRLLGSEEFNINDSQDLKEKIGSLLSTQDIKIKAVNDFDLKRSLKSSFIEPLNNPSIEEALSKRGSN